MEIKAVDVKKLHNKVGAGLMDCKKALVEAKGDHAEAEKILKKKGMVKAEKKSNRETLEGCVCYVIEKSGQSAGMIEAACQTDFVANNPVFKSMAESFASGIMDSQLSDATTFTDVTIDGKTVEEMRHEAVLKLGENIRLVRGTSLQTDGHIYGYSHGNKIAVLVALESSDEQLGRDIAMHIAALNPAAVTANDIPAAVLDEEKSLYQEQLQDSKKPDEIKNKIIEGKLKKFASGLCLYGQPFVKDPKETIEELLKNKNNHVKNFVRFELGETSEAE